MFSQTPFSAAWVEHYADACLSNLIYHTYFLFFVPFLIIIYSPKHVRHRTETSPRHFFFYEADFAVSLIQSFMLLLLFYLIDL